MALENIVSGFLSKLFGNKNASVGDVIKETINEVVNGGPVPQQPSQPAQRGADPQVEQSIASDGYVWQSRLWRRHVMAQMFRLLHGKRDLPMSEANYDRLVNRRMIGYTWRMIKNEMHAQAKLWHDDREQFAERNRWFNIGVVEDMARNLNNADGPELLRRLQNVDSPEKMCEALRNVDWEKGNKSAAWFDAYKGAGAYFTMKNLILFHNCLVHLPMGQVLDRDASFVYLKELNARPGVTGHDMFVEMMKLITDNNFDWRG